MEYVTLWKANARKHKGSLIGVFLLLLFVCLALGTVLTLWNNSGSYIPSEMKRAGFGDLTAWVHDVPELAELKNEMSVDSSCCGGRHVSFLFGRPFRLSG